ncbi:unnamed protein product [Rhizoctonia solani]|uniref:Uncharacterized protein n=1 Tax=Rhizoctonia solani TaxID=456999 RepID=A0A8H3DL19_9AGAM|nr:unnamed protein product [Rhizoctonia solani]
MMLSALLTCFISIIHVQAFVITQPDSTGWPRNVGMMTVRWDTSPSDPPVFTMLLRDASQLSVVNPLAVAANVPSALDAFELNLPTVPVSPKKSHSSIGNLVYIPYHQFQFNDHILVRSRNTEHIHLHIDTIFLCTVNHTSNHVTRHCIHHTTHKRWVECN